MIDKNTSKLEGLSSVLPKDLRFAFEFRHPSWWDEDVYQILRNNSWGLVVLPPCPAYSDLPTVEEITAPFVYGNGYSYYYTYMIRYYSIPITITITNCLTIFLFLLI